MSSRKKESHTLVGEDTLLHGKSLLVVTTADANDVALPLIADRVDLDFLAHALVIEDTDLLFIVDVQKLLAARGRVRKV